MSKTDKNKPANRNQQNASQQPKSQGSATSRREQLRLQREAEAKKDRQRKIGIIAAVVVFAVVLAIIVGVLINTAVQKREGGSEQGIGKQITPPNANADRTGIIVAKDKWDETKPLVTIFEDPQCPGCATAAMTVNPMLESLAKKGEIRVEYQVLHGLDNFFKGKHSYRGTVAMVCADTVGNFSEYSLALYAAQPPREGDGWTDEQLTGELAAKAGLQGDNLSKFTTCYQERQTNDFVLRMQEKRPSYIQATPSYAIGGKVVRFTPADMASEQTLLDAVKRNAG